jgi:hypothetical protein
MNEGKKKRIFLLDRFFVLCDDRAFESDVERQVGISFVSFFLSCTTTNSRGFQ